MALTARSKSFTALRAKTSLSEEEALEAVRRATALEGERGVGKVDGKVTKGRLRALIEAESETAMSLKVAMDQSQPGNLAFDAVVEALPEGWTGLQVGGLTRAQVMQSKILGLIPTSPGTIIHFGFYKRFLERVEAELLAEDPEADVTIGIHEETVAYETGP